MATTGATTHGREARNVAVGSRVRRLATETKAAFKTTEFWAMLGLIVAILVSAALIDGGDNGTDEFIARQAWLYVAILGGAYFISRGLAKSGSQDPYWDETQRPKRPRRTSVTPRHSPTQSGDRTTAAGQESCLPSGAASL